MMLAKILISQEKAKQDAQIMMQELDRLALQSSMIADQLAQQANRSWHVEDEDITSKIHTLSEHESSEHSHA